MARVTFPTIPTKVLANTISSSAMTFKVNNILDWGGNALTSAAFGTYAWAVFRSVDGTKMEVMRIDPSTIASSSITITKRGLSLLAHDYDTEITANKLDWNANETLVELGSNPPQVYNEFARKGDAETIAALWTFAVATRPQLATDTNATVDEELITKGELNRTALGTLTTQTLLVPGTAGETVAAGNGVYFDTTDDEWKLWDADTASTVENVQLGIAQGAGVDGGSISGGVLIRGVDSNQTAHGFNNGDIVYASDTAGGISDSPGTTEVTVGIVLDANSIYFFPRFNQQLTEDQKDALAGTSGTPSSSNKYVTADDVSAAGVADKIVRLSGTSLPAMDGSNLTNVGASAIKTSDINAGETIDGATLPVPVFVDDTANEVLACDANVQARLRYDGFAITASTDGNPITVQTDGIVGGFTSLDIGKDYYVQDAVGTIGTTAGTYEIKVGVAISATQILIQRGTMEFMGSASDSSDVITVPSGARFAIVTADSRDNGVGVTGHAELFLTANGKTSGSILFGGTIGSGTGQVGFSASWNVGAGTITLAFTSSADEITGSAFFYK